MNADESALSAFPDSSVYTQIDPRICFQESLSIYDRFTGYATGSIDISIVPSQVEEAPAYKVLVKAEFTIDRTNYLETIDAHVLTDLTTSRQVMGSDVNGEAKRRVHVKTNLTDEDNMYVLDNNAYRYGIPEEKVAHFLGDGALFVLTRLSLFHNKVGTSVFYASGEDDAVRGSYYYEPLVNAKNELDGASVKVCHIRLIVRLALMADKDPGLDSSEVCIQLLFSTLLPGALIWKWEVKRYGRRESMLKLQRRYSLIQSKNDNSIIISS
jgi:hypothetical protein